MTVKTVKVWDGPVRLFHWGLVVLVVLLCATGEIGGFDVVFATPWGTQVFLGAMDVHMMLGETALTLIVFRLLWGLAGSQTARFSSFVRAPGAAVAYLRAALRGEHPKFAGHNPAGAMMVLTLLALLLAQGASGLFANDDVFSQGPLASLVGKEASDVLSGVHATLFNLLLAAIAAHVAAVALYRLKGENLVTPMVTGRKRAEDVPEGGAPAMAAPRRALALFILAIAIVWGGLALVQA